MSVEINGNLLDFRKDGVMVVSNNKQRTSEVKLIEEFIGMEKGNKVSFLFRSVEVVEDFYRAFQNIRSRNEFAMEMKKFINTGTKQKLRQAIMCNGCCCLFTTQGRVQHALSGRRFADENNYSIMVITKVSSL